MDLLNLSPFNGSQLCAEVDPELFFPEEYDNRAAVMAAKSVCGNCELTTACLTYALANPELDGIWGATTPRERRNMRRRKKVSA
jgi:WhiB family redox-sensing transcriptional regulator